MRRFFSLLESLPSALAIILFFVVSARAGDPDQAYQRIMEGAIAQADTPSQADSPIATPALRSTGSAMYDRAAKVVMQFTVASQYPIALNSMVSKYSQLIGFAAHNAGQITPAKNGLVVMQITGDTTALPPLIKKFAESGAQLRQPVDEGDQS